jgi:beta-glucosidase
MLRFPTGFVWGAATASYQIEGSTTVDGRVESIWDEFCRRPGAVVNGDTGEPAADHYRRYEQDIELMSSLGIGAYRFSIAWPRLADLGFYDRLVDCLLERGISPWATLYHWDLPQALEEQGGWTNRDTAYRFAEYASTVVGRLGDRVDGWLTLNEPWCSAFLGYGNGVHAPGVRDSKAAIAAVHHLLLGHGLAMAEIRAKAPKTPAGITLNLFPVSPATGSEADADAARRIDGLQNRIFLDPVMRGEYATDVLTDMAPFGLPDLIKDGDLEVISAPIDHLGVNYYRAYLVSAGDPVDGPTEWPGSSDVRFLQSGHPKTEMDWEVQPEGLTELLVSLSRKYPGLPLYVTENGAAYPDVLEDGTVRDTDRIAFLDGHLRASHAAIEQGADLRGYFCWTLLDNLEWAEGYAKRFGLVHVDFETQKRTLKDSARWYSGVVERNGLPES